MTHNCHRLKQCFVETMGNIDSIHYYLIMFMLCDYNVKYSVLSGTVFCRFFFIFFYSLLFLNEINQVIYHCVFAAKRDNVIGLTLPDLNVCRFIAFKGLLTKLPYDNPSFIQVQRWRAVGAGVHERWSRITHESAFSCLFHRILYINKHELYLQKN